MATCLVTGGAGFLGSHLCERLLELGNRVICVDNLETGSLRNIDQIRTPEFDFEMLDITSHFEVAGPVDVVYHLASPASPIDYARLPLHTLKVGAYGTHNALGLAKVKRARFLLASTSEVYGDPQIHPQPESYWGNVNPIGPRGVYDEAKRYAEALTMAYFRQQGVDTAIVRIFNSVLADEQVLYDDGRELRRETAGELAERLSSRRLAAVYVQPGDPHATRWLDRPEAVEYDTTGFRVPSFGEDNLVADRPATALVGHPTDQACFEIRTRYGRSIRVTGDHSLFVEGEDGQPMPLPVNDLRLGDRVAIAGRVRVPERDRTEVSMLELWRSQHRDPWELTIEEPDLGERAWAKREDLFGLLVSERRNAGPNWRNGAWTKIIRARQTDSLALPMARRLEWAPGDETRVRPRGCRSALPATITITDDLLWLLGLWVAEGCSHESRGNAYLTISCDDATLERATEIVSDRLGLHVVHGRGSEARSSSIFIHGQLLLRLWEHLGFGDNQKRVPGWILGLPLERLKWFIEGYRVGDGVHSGSLMDEGIRHVFTTVNTQLKDDLIVALGRFGLVPSVGSYRTKIRNKTGEREYPFWMLTLCRVTPWSPLEWDGGVSQKLNARRTGDLVWAQVSAIDEVPASDLVYDFCVPGSENFFAGTGVMAHNTYGARMRPHDGRAVPTFIRQALTDKPLTVFGDGSQTRSFCYVDDLIRGLISLAESGLHDPVNIGNPDELTLLEMAQLIVELTGARSEIVYEALPIDDPQIRQPDISRARDLLAWAPEVSLRDGLRETIDSFSAGLDRTAL